MAYPKSEGRRLRGETETLASRGKGSWRSPLETTSTSQSSEKLHYWWRVKAGWQAGGCGRIWKSHCEYCMSTRSDSKGLEHHWCPSSDWAAWIFSETNKNFFITLAVWQLGTGAQKAWLECISCRNQMTLELKSVCESPLEISQITASFPDFTLPICFFLVNVYSQIG